MKFWKVGVVIFVFTVFAGSIAYRSAKAQSTQQPFIQNIVNAGTSSFQTSVAGTDALQSPELDPRVDFSDDGTGETASPFNGVVINRTIGQGTGQGSSANSGKKAKSNPQLNLSFDGLTFRQQRLANGGNQFSVEPPDQGLCAGNGFVMEAVNDVLRVFDTSGNPLIDVVDLNTFFGYAAQFNRTTGAAGPEVTDPSCYFDPDTQRWFLTVLTLDVDSTTGNFTGPNHIDIAVSGSSSPLGTFSIFRLPVQDDGTQGTPNHGCAGGPCFGDFPHIGADANGFYVTTNEFALFAAGFHGSQIYAFPKQVLASGAASVPVFQFDTANFTLDGHPGHTVWPAITPASAYAEVAGGTEYLLSSVAVFSATRSDTRLRIWALSNTQSLNASTPAPVLNNSVINVNTYGRPPRADQEAGDFPLGQCLDDTDTKLFGTLACWKAFFSSGGPFSEVESNHVDSGDSRVMHIQFANGKIWGALDTAVTLTTVSGSQTKAGIAFYIIQPTATATSVSGTIVKQDVLALTDNHLTYPAIGVTSSGRGVIAFTLLGAGGSTNPGNFPSAAFAAIDAQVGAGDIHIAAAGLGPDDGFTAYKAFVGNGRNRWGDYGAAVADGNSIWIASEYIGQTCTLDQYVTNTSASPLFSCNRTRTAFGNWFTRISKLTP